MKLFFNSYFLLSFFIISLQVHAANTYNTLTPGEQSVAHAVWNLSTEEISGGTGFFISPNHIITNVHVITALLQKAELKNIRLLQEKAQGVVESDIKITKLVALSTIFDLAILETDKSTDTYLKIRTSQIKETENLVTLGYPQDKFSKISQTGALQRLVDKLAMVVNHFPLQGVSGSPVLDETNQVVGVVSNGYENFLLATSSKQLNLLIEKKIGIQCDEDYKQCIKKGLELTIKKAEKGDHLAQYYLSEMSILYFTGFHNISDQNKEKILNLMQKTAEQGNIFSRHNLALLHFQGLGVEKNLEKSFDLLQEAAEKGFVSSQFLIGTMYLQGLGVTKNLEEARKWLIKAAEQDHVIAQITIGAMYLQGMGVTKNLEEARKWLIKAAEQGGQMLTQPLLNQIDTPSQ